MSISDVAAPGDSSAPDVFSPDRLVDLLRTLKISSVDKHQSDAYLTLEMINQAFDALAYDISLVRDAFGTPARMFIPSTWKTLKQNVVTAFCEPYREALAEMKVEHAESQEEIIGLKTKVQELQKFNDSYKAGCLCLTTERSTLKTQIDGLRDSHQAEGLRLTTETSTLRAQIDELHDSHRAEGLRLTMETRTLRAQIDELYKSKDYYLKETLRLSTEAAQLRSQKPKPDGVPATGTRTQTWDGVLNDKYNRMKEILPAVPNPIASDEVDSLAAAVFVKELAMYNRLQQCLSTNLDTARDEEQPGSLVFDTHSKELICGLKPDMSIVTASRLTPTVGGIIAIVELKAGILSKDAFGQLYDYLKGVQHAQPHRRLIIGLLSNLRENQFVVLETASGQRTRCICYDTVSFQIALTYLRDVVIPDAMYHPPASVFTADLGLMVEQLGNPAFSIVGVFPVPPGIKRPKFSIGRWVDPDFEKPYATTEMVVKRTTPGVARPGYRSRAPRTVQNEIGILRQIQDWTKNKKMQTLPRILYQTDDFQEFGMLPRGYPVHPSDTSTNWGKVLTDVLDALKWLHIHKIVHRDVRLDNIIWDVDHAVLIDLGSAIDMTTNEESVLYCGGYVCCPPTVVGNFNSPYIPRPADDCLAVVLLVNTVLFPARWESFRSAELEDAGSPETTNLGQLWKDLESSDIWKPFFLAGCATKYEILKGMAKFFVHL